MKIRFGLHLDGQRGWHSANRLGETVVGPLGFLGILESQLGLVGGRATQAERIVQYRNCLKQCDSEHRFYHRTFEIDELGTAAILLGWRDEWLMGGWSGQFPGAVKGRLQDLAEVEKVAKELVAFGMAERLSHAHQGMGYRHCTINKVQLLDPLTAFPKLWQDILSLLPFKNIEPLSSSEVGAGFLGELQSALLQSQAGKTIDKLTWKDDGSVKFVQGETAFVSGGWVTEKLLEQQFDTVIVQTAQGELLDGILTAANAPCQGFQNPSAFRPALQVLPLALEILWEPINFYGLLQFLTHPICPISGYARRKLAGKLADKPGIGGASWEEALLEIDEHYEDKATQIRQSIACWIEHERYSQAEGAPVVKLLERVQLLAEFFRARLGDANENLRMAFHAGYSQCVACCETLEELQTQGMTRISPQQLSKLVAQATSRGSENPLLVAQVGAVYAVDNPSAVIETFDRVVWWRLDAPSLPKNYPWSKAEIEFLRLSGVILPDLSAILDQISQDWLRPILAARKELILVLPAKGNEVHPLWLMIESLIEYPAVMNLEIVLTQESAARLTVPSTPLPRLRRWWQLPAGVPMVKPQADSYSSLETFLFNPYQWLLRYPAALRPSRILDVSGDFRLYGNLAHSMVERFFNQANALTFSETQLLAWFDPQFDRLMVEEGAVLLMPGKRSDLEGFRIRLRRSMRQLLGKIHEANVSQVIPEESLEGIYVGGIIRGFADLILVNGSGAQAIVDLKWAGKKHAEKLKANRHLQLAIYAEMLRQRDGIWPNVAYYILSSARLHSANNDFFPSAQIESNQTGEGTAHLWNRFVETWKWRQTQVDAGKFELVLESLAEECDEDSIAPEDGLAVETLNPNYNETLVLAGWGSDQ